MNVVEQNADEKKGNKKERDRGKDESLAEAPWRLETVIKVSRRG